jgi:hypothetical protein
MSGASTKRCCPSATEISDQNREMKREGRISDDAGSPGVPPPAPGRGGCKAPGGVNLWASPTLSPRTCAQFACGINGLALCVGYCISIRHTHSHPASTRAGISAPSARMRSLLCHACDALLACTHSLAGVFSRTCERNQGTGSPWGSLAGRDRAREHEARFTAVNAPEDSFTSVKKIFVICQFCHLSKLRTCAYPHTIADLGISHGGIGDAMR